MVTRNEQEENPKKYGMSLDMATTKHHPSYSHLKSAEANYKTGLKYAKEHGLSKEWVGKSLMQLANLTHKKVFHDAAEKAYKSARHKRVMV